MSRTNFGYRYQHNTTYEQQKAPTTNMKYPIIYFPFKHPAQVLLYIGIVLSSVILLSCEITISSDAAPLLPSLGVPVTLAADGLDDEDKG